MNRRECIICGTTMEDVDEVIYEDGERVISEPGKLEIRHCSDCGRTYHFHLDGISN